MLTLVYLSPSQMNWGDDTETLAESNPILMTFFDGGYSDNKGAACNSNPSDVIDYFSEAGMGAIPFS